jgi:hypothetical protein
LADLESLSFSLLSLDNFGCLVFMCFFFHFLFLLRCFLCVFLVYLCSAIYLMIFRYVYLWLFLGPLRTNGFYSYSHKLQMSTCCMLMFRILLTCILKMTLYFNSVHLQDGLVVPLEGRLLVVDVVDLLFVGLLAHVHYQRPRGGNFQISRFFLILISE